MRKVAVRGLLARKVRAALTATAILLGVMMIAGTYVLTDTINASFDDIFQAASEGIDVKVTPHETVELDDEGEPLPLDASVLEQVKAVPGVQAASGNIFDDIAILGDDGKAVSSGAPMFAASVPPDRFSPFAYPEGRAPRSDGEVAVDKFTAEREKFEIGESIRLAGEEGARSYRVVGVAKFGDVESFGGASLAIVTLGEAQRLTGNTGKFSDIDVAAEPGTSAEQLRDSLKAALPADAVDVRTGTEQAAQDSADSRDDLGFLRTALLAFALISLFVGSFIIFNTFSITVAQRTREFGMLRTLGASRRQVLTSVLSEALAIGLVASVAGIVGGVGFAKAIQALFKAIGFDLPAAGTVIETRTIVVSLVIGMVVTLLASISPAVRATRVSPLEALHEGVTGGPRKESRLRTVLSFGITAIGVGVILLGLFGTDDSDDALSLLALGVFLVFLGVGLLARRLVRPLASVLGTPIERVRGITGRLARENSMRNPARTAVTAASLMIGLALVTFVTVFAAGLKKGTENTIDQNFAGDIVLQHTDGFSGIPAAAGELVRDVPGVKTVSPWRTSNALVQGMEGTKYVTGLDPASANEVFTFEWKQGSPDTLAGLGPRQAIADKAFADKNDVEVGDTLRVTTPTRKKLEFEVVGTIKDNADFVGDFIVPVAVVTEGFGQKQDSVALAALEPGADVKAVRAEIDRRLEERFPTVESLNQKEIKERQAEQFQTVLFLFYGLLSLAIVVSIFGIVNTLVLTIHERTRELGLLRAVGMSRRQVKRIVRYESVITALIGTVLGSALGVFFAFIISRPIADEGFVLVLPIASLIVFFVLAVMAGVLAAVPPARRAAKLDVLEALAYE